MKSTNELLDIMPQIGKIEVITYRSEKKGSVKRAESVRISVESGMELDYQSKTGGKRMVTFIQQEHFPVLASILGKDVAPEDTRRNIVVSGINLRSLYNRTFQIGDSLILKGTGYCVPCQQMEKNLGPGGLNAMWGHGGITATVIQTGNISTGDKVKLLLDEE